MAPTRSLVAAGYLAAVQPWRTPIRHAVAAAAAAVAVRSFATRGQPAKATATQARTTTEEAPEWHRGTERRQDEEPALVAVPDHDGTPSASPSSAASPSAVSAALARDQTRTHAAPSPGGELFAPRAEYEAGTGTLRAYFPGHHRAALTRMRRDLGHIGLIIECRDLRVPLTSWNPVLEAALMLPTGGGGSGTGTDASPIPGLAGPFPGAAAAPAASGERTHILVYTKRDLVVDGTDGGGSGSGSGSGSDCGQDDPLSPTPEDLQRLADFHRRRGGVDAVVFLGADEKSSSSSSSVAFTDRGRRETTRLLKSVRAAARRHGAHALTDLRAPVVGLPNAGKSTLLNRLRARGMTDPQRRGRAARTGAQPGVTRKMGTPVRVLEEAAAAAHGPQNGVLLFDTPGVFLPYVADPESMLKLALVGSVREGLVPAVQLADYLLFQLNRQAAAAAAQQAHALAAPADGGPAALAAPAAAVLPSPAPAPSPSPSPSPSSPPPPPPPPQRLDQPSNTPMPALEGAAVDAVASVLAKLKLAAAAATGTQLQQLQPQQHWPPYVAAYGLPRPTEDVHVLLDAVARRSGKLLRGGQPDHTAAAMQFVYAWRHGRLGRFCLDDLGAEALAAAAERQRAHREAAPRSLSLNQARNREKARRKAAAAAKRGHNA